MAASLEEVLSRHLDLNLEPDNENGKVSADLKEIFKDPGALQLLYQILGSSAKPGIRQLAAQLMRKKIIKSKQWLDLDDTLKNDIRGSILQLVEQEPEENARAAIAQVIAVIARHGTDGWPALHEFIFDLINNGDSRKKETGLFLLSTVTSCAAKQMRPVLTSALSLLADTLNKSDNSQVSYLAIKSLKNLASLVKDPSELKLVEGVLPQAFEVVQELVAEDQEKACEALAFFVEMLEVGLAIVMPHLDALVQYCLKVASNKDDADELRVKAMLFIATLVNQNIETFLEYGLLDPFLELLITTICGNPDEDFDGRDEEDEEYQMENPRPPAFSVLAFETLAYEMSSEKLLSHLMPKLEVCLSSEDPLYRRAAFIVMYGIVGDCKEYFVAKLLPKVVEMFCAGFNDSSPLVRYAALFAIVPFARHLQPDISKYASTLIPVVFSYLNKSMDEAEKNPKSVGLSHFALDTFCENLGDEVMPFLPDLMSHYLNILETCPLNKPRVLAISSVGTAAKAGKENMAPYFNAIHEHVKPHIFCKAEDDDVKGLQMASIYTMSALASNVGKKTFGPIAKDYLDFGLKLLSSSSDPDLRRSVYSLLSSISTIVDGDMAGCLEEIVKFMLLSVTSTEDSKAENNADEDESDEEDLDEEELDEDELETENDEEKFYMENEDDDEKEAACLALGEIAKNLGSSFLPYLQQAYNDMYSLMASPADSVRKAAYGSLSQFCQCMHDIHTDKQSGETAEAVERMIAGVVPKYLEAIADLDLIFSAAAVVSIHAMLDKIGRPVLSTVETTQLLLASIKDLLTQNKIPLRVEDKAVALRTLAKVMEVSGEAVDTELAAQLRPVLLELASDKEEAVRNNAILANGMLNPSPSC